MSSSAYSRPGRGTVLLSVGIHVLALAGLWVGQGFRTAPIEYVTFTMELITEAELADLSTAPDEPEVETPNAPPPEPEPEPEPEPIPEPVPDPEPEPAPPEPEPEPEPAPTPEPEVVEQPTPPAENLDISRASTEEMTIRMEGLRQDYPQYYEQIVLQISRCFRWTTGGRWRTIVRFEIQRDGTIPGSSIQFYQQSGNSTFDIQAFGAVECAGAGRLSPLPEDLPYDALPIQFTFSPA